MQSVAFRAAKVGDVLVSTAFTNSITHGFAAEGCEEVAVCLIPGTELGFAEPVRARGSGISSLLFGERQFKHTVAKFVQLNVDEPYRHHDALQFPDDVTCLINDLVVGQKCNVLQLPAAPRTKEEAEPQERLEVAA